jgi:hypothetical protein
MRKWIDEWYRELMLVAMLVELVLLTFIAWKAR